MHLSLELVKLVFGPFAVELVDCSFVDLGLPLVGPFDFVLLLAFGLLWLAVEPSDFVLLLVLELLILIELLLLGLPFFVFV